MNDSTATVIIPQQPTSYMINRRIGSTTYNVNVHFSKTSRENINDKILRLIRNDMTAGEAVKK